MSEVNHEFPRTLYLDDGRRLGYREYGDSSGFPIIGFHGTPGSSHWFDEDDPVSTRLGIRLITPDRPGYGLSDNKPGRKINDFNVDIDQLVRHLEIGPFSLLGVSGGTPYALALGAAGRTDLYKLGIVASAYPFVGDKPPKDMCRPNKMGFFMARYLPAVMRFFYSQQKKLINRNLELYIASSQKNINHLCSSDQEIVIQDGPSRSMASHLREAFRSNAYEAVHELRLLSNDWQIEYKEINVPVEVWHGIEDTLSPIAGLRQFVGNFPYANTHYLENKGHFLDEDLDIWANILQSLLP